MEPDLAAAVITGVKWFIAVGGGALLPKICKELWDYWQGREKRALEQQRTERRDTIDDVWKMLDRERENLKAINAGFDDFRKTATTEIKSLNETINQLVRENATLTKNACDQIPTCLYRHDKTHPND